MAKKKILIIGGGMAGMVSAIIAAEGGAKVTLLERNDKIGKKLLVTGNGRCNLSNKNVNPSKYHTATANIFEAVYNQFDLEATKDFMASIGIDLIELEDGKLYPQSLQALSVVKALLYRADEVGVDIYYNHRVLEIEYTDKFRVSTENQKFYGDYLIIATGGKSYAASGSSGDGYALARSFGHHVIEPMPSIVQLVTNNAYNKSLKGLKVEARTKLVRTQTKEVLREESGEVLFTEYGLSGPTILQLSTLVAPLLYKKEKLSIYIDFFPKMTIENIDSILMKRFHQFPARQIEQVLNGFIHQRLIIPILKYSQVNHTKQAANVTKEERLYLANALKNYMHPVEDTYLWNQAQVTKGGINCNEVDPLSLMSLLRKNLYFAGEVLDIDGDCGGYNLQWAISSGGAAAIDIMNT